MARPGARTLLKPFPASSTGGILALLLLGLSALGPAPALASEEDLRIAKDFYHAQRYADAWDALQNVLRADPDSLDGNYYAGLVHLESRQLPRARGYFLKALEVDPLHKEAAEKAVETLTREARGSATRARVAYEFPIRKYGLYLGPLVHELFKIYAAQNQADRIVRVASGMVDAVEEGTYQRRYATEGAEALLLASKVAYQGGDLQKASTFLSKARGLNGGIPGISDMDRRIREGLEERARPAKERGDTFALRGEYAKALEQYKEALDIYPSWGEVRSSILSVSNLQEAERLFEEAKALEASGEVQAALVKYTRALEKTPQDSKLQNRLDLIRQRMTERQQALAQEEAARKKAEREKLATFRVAFEQAEAAAAGDRWIEAEEAYEEALTLLPTDETVKEKLAQAREKAKVERRFDEGVEAFRKKRYPDAREAFEDVQRQDNTFPNLKRYLALTYFNLDLHEKARVLGEEYLQQNPHNKEMNYVLGVIHHKRVIDDLEGPRTAISYFEKVDDEYYNDVRDRLSDLRWRLNRVPYIGVSVALVLWVAAIFWKKKRPEIKKNTFLGKVERYAAKENWKALAQLEEEARRYPLDRTQDLAVNTAMAQAFYNLKDYQKAISWANLALSSARENPNLILLLGRIYYDARIISQETLRFLVALANQEPENTELAKFIGEFCLDKQVLNDETMPILRNLALVMPEHDKLRRMLIRGYLRNDDKSARAMALYRVELEKSPDNVDLRYMVAFDCMKSGRTEECIKHCEEILNAKLNHAPTHELLRRAYGKLGKLDDLARIYQGILEADPYNPAVQESLKKILEPGSEDAGGPGDSGEGPKRCPNCNKTVQVGQYYCTCGHAL